MKFEIYDDSRFPDGKIAIYYDENVSVFIISRSVSSELRREMTDRFNRIRKHIYANCDLPDGEVGFYEEWIVVENVKSILRKDLYGFSHRIYAYPYPQGVTKIVVDAWSTSIHLYNLGADVPDGLLQNPLSGSIDFVVYDNCNLNTLQKVLEVWQPKVVIPIQGEEDQESIQTLSQRWPVEVLNHGDTFEPVSPGFDKQFMAEIVAIDLEAKRNVEIKNPNHETWWKVKSLSLGCYLCYNGAVDVLEHMVYNPKGLIGFRVYDVYDDEACEVSYEGGAVWRDCSFLPDMTPLAFFNNETEGEPICKIPFQPGEKVWAWMQKGLEALVPCEVIGPATEEMQEEYFSHCEECARYDVRFLAPGNWECRFVAVRPLVFIEGIGHRVMQEVEIIPASFLFPYREFDVK
jgi:hypothetical protein